MKTKFVANIFLLSVLVVQALFLSIIPQRVFAQGTFEVPVSEVIPQSHLIISAVQITGGTGKTQEDFIELFNPTTTPVDLNGYRLVKRTAMGTTDSVIKAWGEEAIVPAQHFYLWANSGFTLLSTLRDADSSATLADNNGIALRSGDNDIGEIVDSLTWGSTANGFADNSLENPSANESLVRVELFDGSSNFNVQVSNPRNSSVELLPDQPEDQPEETPEDQSEETPAEEDPEIDTETETSTEEPVGEGTSNEVEIEPVVNIAITEILPNPSGSDAGFEQIELYNSNGVAISLLGYKLDDIGPNQVLSSNAYSLPNLEIGAESYLSIVLPSGSMSLNNTGGDVVSLFGPQGELVASMFYEESALEGKSYSYFTNGWQWTEASFGQSNILPVTADEEGDKDDDNTDQDDKNSKVDDKQDYDNSGLEITEILPQPDPSGTEFIEIYNSGAKTAQLSMVTLYIGDRKKILPKLELQAGKYFVVEQNELPIQLRNFGQVVKLQEGSNVLSEVTYPTAIENQSFAKFEDGFLWTSQATKSADNILKIPETLKKELSNIATKTSAKNTSSGSAKSVSKGSKTSTTKTTASKNTAVKQADNKNTDQSTASKEVEDDQSSSSITEAPKKQKESLGRIIAMGAAAVIGGVVALYKLVLSVSAE